MEQQKEDNAFPVQIRHDLDGYFFLPKEYNQQLNAWLYECPGCQSQIIISPVPQEEEQQQEVAEEKPREKKKKVRTNSPVLEGEVPLSQLQQHQSDQQQESTTEVIQPGAESLQSGTETGQA